MTDFPGYEYYGDLEADAVEMSRWYNFDGYQEWTTSTAMFPPASAEQYLIAKLASEAGEVAGNYGKKLRDGWSSNYNEKQAKELGDVLWYIAQLAKFYGYDLSDIAKMNVDKLTDRKDRGVISGSGDAR